MNFDSHDSFTFGDCLDVIGMNTYDPIAKYDAYPAPDQIRDAWWWIVYKARTLTARFKPARVMITEVGYPSVAHAHVGPWDFRTDKPVDLALQNELLKGAFEVLRNWTDGEAVFYYLYGENLNPQAHRRPPGPHLRRVGEARRGHPGGTTSASPSGRATSPPRPRTSTRPWCSPW